MGVSSTCPACRSVLAPIDIAPSGTGTCPKCGTSFKVPSVEANPFAPPETELGPPPGLVDDIRDVVPATVLGKFLESFRMLGANLPLFVPLILTIWLPGIILIDLTVFNHPETEAASFRWNQVIETFFGPIYVGALLYALAGRRRGRKVGYFEAISAGMQSWGRLFGARFFTGWIILLGLIVLIVPGIILMIRFALLDPIVVLEGKSGPEARSRSKALTKGKGWQILFAGISFYGTFLPFTFGLGAILGEMELVTNVATAVVLDSMTTVLSTVMIIFMFLFYWEEILREEARMAREEMDDESAPITWLIPEDRP